MKHFLVLLSLAAGIALTGCSSSKPTTVTTTPSTPAIPVPSGILGTQGAAYSISVFAQVPSTVVPDDLVQVGTSIFVVCQDPNINPDGTLPPGVTSAQSLVLEYDTTGKLLQTFDVPGHPDGEVAFNSTTVWVSSNEDANPVITVIDTTNNSLQSYTSDVATLPHGGGIDDLKLINGVVYASASNPTTTFSPSPNLAPYSTDGNGATAEYGVNTGPTLYAVSLNSDGKTFHSTPVVWSSTPATLVGGGAVTLNMTDSDSSMIDPSGNFVEASQQDSELVWVYNLGKSNQSISVLPVTLYGNPWPLDDTRWSPASGNSFMLLSDAGSTYIYRIDAAGGAFAPTSAYSAGQGTLLQTNTITGVLTPIYVGMSNPHGLIFVAD